MKLNIGSSEWEAEDRPRCRFRDSGRESIYNIVILALTCWERTKDWKVDQRSSFT
jgi:hypothetical protein